MELMYKNLDDKRAYEKRRYLNNPERFRAQAIAYYWANRVRILNQKTEYGASRKEEKRAYNVAYYSTNKEAISAANKAYLEKHGHQINTERRRRRKLNGDTIRAHARAKYALNPSPFRKANAKRRAIIAGAEVTNLEAIAEWEKRWRTKQKVKCYWCLREFHPLKCQTDHIAALSLGGDHSPDNVCISCAACNQSKRDKWLTQWNRKIAQPTLPL